MSFNLSSEATTVPNQTSTFNQSIEGELAIGNLSIQYDPRHKVLEAFERLFKINSDTMLVLIGYFFTFMILFAVVQLFFVAIASKRRKATWIAPVCSKETAGSSIVIYLLNLAMIILSFLAIVICLKGDYSSYDYVPFLYAGMCYSFMLFVSTLFTVYYSRSNIPEPMPRFFLILFLTFAFLELLVGLSFAVIYNLSLDKISDVIVYFLVECIIRTIFIVISYMCSLAFSRVEINKNKARTTKKKREYAMVDINESK